MPNTESNFSKLNRVTTCVTSQTQKRGKMFHNAPRRNPRHIICPNRKQISSECTESQSASHRMPKPKTHSSKIHRVTARVTSYAQNGNNFSNMHHFTTRVTSQTHNGKKKSECITSQPASHLIPKTETNFSKTHRIKARVKSYTNTEANSFRMHRVTPRVAETA